MYSSASNSKLKLDPSMKYMGGFVYISPCKRRVEQKTFMPLPIKKFHLPPIVEEHKPKEETAKKPIVISPKEVVLEKKEQIKPTMEIEENLNYKFTKGKIKGITIL